MESVQRELEPVKQEQQSEQPKEEKLSAGKSVFVGFQHVLAMDLFIPPIILAGLLSFTVADTALLIQMTFIACGLATLIQAGFSNEASCHARAVICAAQCTCSDWNDIRNRCNDRKFNTRCDSHRLNRQTEVIQ